MASGFVSGGTVDASTGEEVAGSDAVKTNETNNEWAKAALEVEETRRRKAEASRDQGGKSLFEVLEANKARKQEAFEESIRLKNQFRSLDEDEIEFLDSVLESTRAKEAALKKETAEQLEIFRRHQEDADKAIFLEEEEAGRAAAAASGGSGSPVVEEEQWTVGGRKRKKGREKEGLKGVKIRRTSSTSEQIVTAATSRVVSNPSPSSRQPRSEAKDTDSSPGQSKLTVHNGPPSPTAKKLLPVAPAKLEPKASAALVIKPTGGGLLGLDYGSDDDDD